MKKISYRIYILYLLHSSLTLTFSLQDYYSKFNNIVESKIKDIQSKIETIKVNNSKEYIKNEDSQLEIISEKLNNIQKNSNNQNIFNKLITYYKLYTINNAITKKLKLIDSNDINNSKLLNNNKQEEVEDTENNIILLIESIIKLDSRILSCFQTPIEKILKSIENTKTMNDIIYKIKMLVEEIDQKINELNNLINKLNNIEVLKIKRNSKLFAEYTNPIIQNLNILFNKTNTFLNLINTLLEKTNYQQIKKILHNIKNLEQNNTQHLPLQARL